MDRVLVELEANDAWVPMGPLVRPDMPPASMTSTPRNGLRQVYVFGWWRGRGPALWRSAGGVDVETGIAREINSIGMIHLEDLTTTPHLLTLFKGRVALTIRLQVVVMD